MSLKFHTVLAVALPLVIGLGSSVAAAPDVLRKSSSASSIDARLILKQVDREYAALKNYSDRGKVQVVYKRKGRYSFRRDIRFTTQFTRPGYMRFEFATSRYDPPCSGVVTLEKAHARVKTSLESGTKEANGIGEALHSVAGITSGLSQYIPKLLLPRDVKGKPITQMHSPQLVVHRGGKNKGYWIITEKGISGSMQLWVKDDEYRITKIVSIHNLPNGFTSTTTVSYQIQKIKGFVSLSYPPERSV